MGNCCFTYEAGFLLSSFPHIIHPQIPNSHLPCLHILSLRIVRRGPKGKIRRKSWFLLSWAVSVAGHQCCCCYIASSAAAAIWPPVQCCCYIGAICWKVLWRSRLQHTQVKTSHLDDPGIRDSGGNQVASSMGSSLKWRWQRTHISSQHFVFVLLVLTSKVRIFARTCSCAIGTLINSSRHQ